ncbi:MAG: lamin tail domain-containing protein [Bacteroidota bacterium]
MPTIDFFSANGQAGFDEGWIEGGIEAEMGITGSLDLQICHGIDLAVDIEAAAEAQAKLRLLVLGAKGEVGVLAHAGLRGQATIEPNVFDRFGLNVQVQAAAEVAARARLEIALESEYIAELASQELDGLALEIFLAFLRELRVGGGVLGKIAYSAMARGWLAASGNFLSEDEGGFKIGGGYSLGLKGGYGMDYFMVLDFENPRRFFKTTVELITEEIVNHFREELPTGSEIGIELFQLLVPLCLEAAYDIGQRSLTQGISSPKEIVLPFLEAFAEALQLYLLDKVADFASQLIAQMIEEALIRSLGQEMSQTDKDRVLASSQQLIQILSDGKFSPEDIPEVLHFATTVFEVAAPEMAERVQRPISILWTAMVVGISLREVGALIAEGDISVLGFGVSARARIREMPSISEMPDLVQEEYISVVDDFDGTELTFDHAMDYLLGIGIGPLLRDQLPELASVLDLLYQHTGISPGNIVTFGIQGMIGANLTETELYQELKTFIQRATDEVIQTHVYDRLEEIANPNPDAQLYLEEVAKPSIELMLGFVFQQIDLAVADPGSLSGGEILQRLQSGISSVLYKIMARNLVVMEQIASSLVREQSVSAFAQLEQTVRTDETSLLMQSSVDHIDLLLATISEYVPIVPGQTGLNQEQLDALQIFIADMLNIAQESLSKEIFTDEIWNRRRTALLQLLLSLDAEINWNSRDLLESIGDKIASCGFIPDKEALEDLWDVQLDILLAQSEVLFERLPEPLTRLLLAFTEPQLRTIQQEAQAHYAQLLQTISSIRASLEEIPGKLAAKLQLWQAALADLIPAFANASLALVSSTFQSLKTALIERGKENLQTLNAPQFLIDGFDVSFEVIVIAVSTIVNDVFTLIRSWNWESMIDGLIEQISIAELALIGDVSYFQAGVEQDMESLVLSKVSELYLDEEGNPKYPILTFVLEAFTALSTQDYIELTVAEALTAINISSLIEPKLLAAIYGAQHADLEARQSSAQTDLEFAEIGAEASKDDSRSRIIIHHPLAPKNQTRDWFAFGPVVPLSFEVTRSGSAWADTGGARRIQIACNGQTLHFSPGNWTYDDHRKALTFLGSLRLDQEQIRPGLNVLEISVANAEHATVRAHAIFLVDPDGQVPLAGISIDPTASQFNSPGSDHDSTYEEYVVIHWEGEGSISLDGWKVRDKVGTSYTFMPLQLDPGQSVRLRTGGDPMRDTNQDRHWGRKKAVWNNTGDTIFLIDPQGHVRYSYVYPSFSSHHPNS